LQLLYEQHTLTHEYTIEKHTAIVLKQMAQTAGSKNTKVSLQRVLSWLTVTNSMAVVKGIQVTPSLNNKHG